MRKPVFIAAVAILVLLGVLAAVSLFTVHQTEQAIVVRFGNPKRVIKESGLHFKHVPWENIVVYDSRVLDYAPPAEEVIAADQKRLVVDSFARYRIVDPLLFYQRLGNESAARAQLRGILSASLRRVIGNRTLTSVLSEERHDIMRQIRDEANEEAKSRGLEIIDVRIRRADLPQANAEAIYQRMQSERQREAAEFRAQGVELAQRVRSRAERERTVLLAEAQRQAQVSRGEGDAEATRIYADAFNRDPEFYAFYRSMEAYRNALTGNGTTLVLTPDSEFFRYFGTRDVRETSVEPAGGPRPGPASAPPATAPGASLPAAAPVLRSPDQAGTGTAAAGR